MGNQLSRSRLQGRVKRGVTGRPVWCSARSLLTGWNGLPARAAGLPRVRAVVLCGAEAVTHISSYTNYLPPTPLSHAPHRTHSAHLRTAPHISSASRPTIASPVHSPDRTHAPGRTTHAFLCTSLLFCCHRIAQRYGCHR